DAVVVALGLDPDQPRNNRVKQTLAALAAAARGDGNLVYPIMECVEAYAGVGEICDTLRALWGKYDEVIVV
nr:methylmalonyl-CoA mutase family protein [bacterium]